MYNVKAAVSRLPFGLEPKNMEVTDIATGHFVFVPVTGESVSYEALEEAIVGAGYEIEEAWIVVSGTVNETSHLETPEGQAFHLTAVVDELKERLRELAPGATATVEGSWDVREGIETIVAKEVRVGSEVLDEGEPGQ